MRAVCIASISPSASICASVCVAPMRVTRNFAGSSSFSFSSRPGSSSPPVKYSTLAGSTPYSSCRMPRIHTGAVIWYSGVAIALADEVLRLADPALRGHEDARLPEAARREHRNGDERRIVARDRHRVRRQRHLGDVEFAVPQHPEERLLDVQVEVVEIDAVGTHGSVRERAGPVVVPAGQGQLQSWHGHLPGQMCTLPRSSSKHPVARGGRRPRVRASRDAA